MRFFGYPIQSIVLFVCAAVMFHMGIRRHRAGQGPRALFNFFMAVCMAIFGMGYF